MESLQSTKDDLEQSIGLLSQENVQRKSFLRLSTKNSTPRRISLLQGQHSGRRSINEDIRTNDIANRVMSPSDPYKSYKSLNLSNFDSSITMYNCKKTGVCTLLFKKLSEFPMKIFVYS